MGISRYTTKSQVLNHQPQPVFVLKQRFQICFDYLKNNQISHCVHTHITPLAEFTYLTEPFTTEVKGADGAKGERYSVDFPDAPMVAYCAKGIAGKKDAGGGALLLGHLMSHEPCHTLHPIHPAHPPAPPFLHPSFLCIHISRYVYTLYTYVLGVYTRRIRVYTKLHLCIHKI
jgi:hypothetical protein